MIPKTILRHHIIEQTCRDSNADDNEEANNALSIYCISEVITVSKCHFVTQSPVCEPKEPVYILKETPKIETLIQKKL